MRLVVGLGNPGPRYARTRHNVGFRVIERLGARHGVALAEGRFHGRFGRGRVGGLPIALLEPLTFMNRAGLAVAAAVAGLELEDPARDLVVVTDDVDLPFGRLRVRPAGGAGGHRGLSDVIAQLGRDDFPRLRLGVGRPTDDGDTADWVLEPFTPDEEHALPALVDRAADALEVLLADGPVAAMNRFNAAAP